jgi:hypothetical protein
MSDHADIARDIFTLEPGPMGLDLTTIASVCCSLTCCVLFLAVIIGGIVFVLRRGKGGAEQEADDGPSADLDVQRELDNLPPPAPTMAPQPPPLDAVEAGPPPMSEEEAPTVIAPPPDGLEAARSAPSTGRKKPKAGQTIIAFDDDDEDF